MLFFHSVQQEDHFQIGNGSSDSFFISVFVLDLKIFSMTSSFKVCLHLMGPVMNPVTNPYHHEESLASGIYTAV